MKLIVSFFLFIQVTVGLAQDTTINSNYIGSKLYLGKIINNYVTYDSFPKSNPTVILEASYGKQTTGSKNWEQYYGFPQVGVSAVGGYLGNKEEFGFLLGAYPHVSLNTINTKKWNLKIKLGLGMAYFNKPYDSISNPHNILIGSHFTALGFAELYFHRSISEKLTFEFGLSVFHASNGHTGLPNVGLNIININSGFKYYIDKQPSEFKRTPNLDKDKQLNHIIRLGIGTHKFGSELGPVSSPSYQVYDIAYYMSKPIGTLGSGMVGIGYKYYTSYYNKIIEGDIYSEGQHLKSSVITLLLAYEFEFGQMSLLVQGGINVYHPFWKEFVNQIGDDLTFYKKIEGLISTRLGLQYYILDKEKFNNNIYLGLYIKANMGGADFMSSGIGYKF
jgi:lipid A 3-O-deacylase PagL